MKVISFDDNPHRKAHFDFFYKMTHPHFNICANVDITNLLSFLKTESALPTSVSIVYVLSRAANDIPEFRRRIREEEGDSEGKVVQIVEHETATPSFTVATDAADVFSFCQVEYEGNARAFVERAARKAKEMKSAPTFEDESGRDDFLFLSVIPWISFTGYQHAMNYHPHDCIPRITWGKFFVTPTSTVEKTMMPLSVQVHHALVDGRHVGQYFQLVEKICADPKTFFG